VPASAYGADTFGCINRDTMWEAHNKQRYDEGDDLQADLDGLGSVIPNPQISADITEQSDEQH